MIFSSTIFLFAFLPIVLVGYYVIFRGIRARNYFLLVMSLLFYAWGEPRCVFLMIGSILANFLFGYAVDRSPNLRVKRIVLALSVMFNLGILFCFKYLNFTVDNINALLGTRLFVPRIALPIGISFFTFQAMSYVIDVYRGTTEVQRNPLYLGLYISFFPQLIAGPIVRYNTIAEQINQRSVDLDMFQDGLCRFIEGFSKKVILANVLSLAAEKTFDLALQGELSVAMAWLGAIGYTLHIFFDFSGYSDMAIGLGAMFGFRFEENFRYPYLARSVSEFWNRWHISLGQWFRDYVYFPLGGSRVNKAKLLRNLFVVWLLTGVWHGAAWQYIVWGLGYGCLIAFEKLSGYPKKFKTKPAAFLYGLLTLYVVTAGMVIFGAPGLHASFFQLGAMFGIGDCGLWDVNAAYVLSEYLPYYIFAALFATPLPQKLLGRMKQGNAYHVFRAAAYLLLLAVSVSFLAMGAHNPFIYFNF